MLRHVTVVVFICCVKCMHFTELRKVKERVERKESTEKLRGKVKEIWGMQKKGQEIKEKIRIFLEH